MFRISARVPQFPTLTSLRGPGLSLAIVGVGMGLAAPAAESGTGRADELRYYSTAEAPRDYDGPRPLLLALGDPAPTPIAAPLPEPESEPVFEPMPLPDPAVPRVARTGGGEPKTKRAAAAPTRSQSELIAQAKQAIADCRERFRQVEDYTCTFVKRERIDGRLNPQNAMLMKARTTPFSIYFKFQTPNKGREAIYVAGQNGGKALAHDVGVGKLLAGTLHLDPKGPRAMEDNRHPISDAGIGNLIETIAKHWAVELTPAESVITFHNELQVGGRPCTMIESVHPRKRPGFLFHTVKLYIDREHGVPIRIEAYDWPRSVGAAPELLEEYSYLNLRLNSGLTDRDFDAANPQYSFGRF